MTLNEVGRSGSGGWRSGATRPSRDIRASGARPCCRTPRWSPSRSGASSLRRVSTANPRGGRPLRAARRGRAAASPGRLYTSHLAAWRKARRQGDVAGPPPRASAAPGPPSVTRSARRCASSRRKSGSAGEGVAHRAHDPGSTGKSCRAAGIQPQRREGLLMAASRARLTGRCGPSVPSVGRVTAPPSSRPSQGHSRAPAAPSYMNARPLALWRVRTRACAQRARLPSLRRPRARRGRSPDAASMKANTCDLGAHDVSDPGRESTGARAAPISSNILATPSPSWWPPGRTRRGLGTSLDCSDRHAGAQLLPLRLARQGFSRYVVGWMDLSR